MMTVARSSARRIHPLSVILAAQAAHEEHQGFVDAHLDGPALAYGADALFACYVRQRAEGVTLALPVATGDVAIALCEGLARLPGNCMAVRDFAALALGARALLRGASIPEVNRIAMDGGPPLSEAVDNALATLARYMGPPGKGPAPWAAALECVGAIAQVFREDAGATWDTVVGAVTYLEMP